MPIRTDEYMDHVRRVLMQHYPDGEIRVEPTDRHRIAAVVVSAVFTGKDEGQRQRHVWSHLMDTLSEEERRRLEFVFTNAPGEAPVG